jgi:hypothetical protein
MGSRRLSRGLPVVYQHVGHRDLVYETSVRSHIAEPRRPAQRREGGDTDQLGGLDVAVNRQPDTAIQQRIGKD